MTKRLYLKVAAWWALWSGVALAAFLAGGR